MRTAPSGQERARAGVAAAHQRQLHRTAADVERDALGERRRVHRGQVAVARLLRRGQDLDLQAAAVAGRGEELLLVARVADRGGGDGADVRDLGRRAEVAVELERAQRALHRRGLQRPGLLEALPDPDTLVDLVRPPPPESSTHEKTTSRNEFEPRSMTAWRRMRGA
jgi:hypothetical protein